MSGAGEWLAAQQAGDQRRFLNLLAGSVVAHVGFVAVMGVMPAPPRPALPEVLSIDLVGLPAAPKARATRPRPPAPPVPKQIVLPKQAPGAVPRKKAVPPPPEPIDYEDALSQLRNELGESLPEPVIPLESHATPADTLPQAAATAILPLALEFPHHRALFDEPLVRDRDRNEEHVAPCAGQEGVDVPRKHPEPRSERLAGARPATCSSWIGFVRCLSE